MTQTSHVVSPKVKEWGGSCGHGKYVQVKFITKYWKNWKEKFSQQQLTHVGKEEETGNWDKQREKTEVGRSVDKERGKYLWYI